jgi:hypothetical protein
MVSTFIQSHNGAPLTNFLCKPSKLTRVTLLFHFHPHYIMTQIDQKKNQKQE